MGKHVEVKRVTINTLIAPATRDALKAAAKARGIGQGVIIDEAVAALLKAPVIGFETRVFEGPDGEDCVMDVPVLISPQFAPAPTDCDSECEHKAEAEFLHGEVRALQLQLDQELRLAPHTAPPTVDDLKQVIQTIETGRVVSVTPPQPEREKKREMSVAERRALEEKQRLDLIASCDERARLVGREDIEYDLEAAPSRPTPLKVEPRAARTQPTKKASYKTLDRPCGQMMSKKGHEQRHD